MALPAFFDPIVNAPRWQKFALGIFGLVILAAGSYFLVLSPLEIKVTVAAEGGYHQLGEFFERVAGFPRVVTVQEMRMAGISKSRNPLKADLVLATYQYRPVGSPPAPKPGQPGAPK